MVYTKNTTAGHHQQDTDYYCGAATAQMILDSIGAGLLDQNTLYNSNHSHNTQSGWATDPDGLNFTLNNYKQLSPTFHSYFVIARPDTELEGSRRIIGAIEVYGFPTGTLVFGCGHWIVVRGFSTDVSPTSPAYSILGFFVNNPWPPTPSFYNAALAPPPSHSVGDGCGTGGNRGIANEYITYTQWANTYLTGCDVWNVGHNQYVSVVDPRMPKLGELAVKHEKIRAKGDRLITFAEAADFVLRSVEEHNLLRDEHFVKALKGAKPSQPVLVQRLDLPDTYYYLIPMKTDKGTTAMLSIGGLHGEFQGGQAFTKPAKEILKRPVDVSKELKNSLSKPIELGERLGKLIIREGAYCFHPLMVWRPCEESRSPYYPFYMITVGNRQIYIGYDGQIYPRLHDLNPGG